MNAPAAHHITVARTARYHTMGPAEAPDVCLVLHGYGQLARYFVQPFAALADVGRRIIAPEALSRFYLDGFDGRVGATWMTRADREHEIGDYIRYLDALADAEVGAETGLTVLGFSQGTATACRWAARGTHAVDRLILWAGGVPSDVDWTAHRERFEAMDLTLVIGTEDEYITDEQVAQQEARLHAHQIPHRTVRFDGGHRIDAEVLAQVAGPRSEE